MSDTTAKPTEKVSMSKGARPVRPPVENIKPPRTIDLAGVALVVTLAIGIVRAFLMLGYTAQLTKFVRHANATSKSPDKHFTAADAAHAVHTVRTSGFVNAAVVAVALLLLLWAMRRTRSASISRWVMLIVFVFTGLPLQVMPTSELPGAVNAVGVIGGVAAIITLVLVFLPPQSQQYFKACKLANTPEQLRGQPRPGLASLFGPKRQAGMNARTAAPAPKPAASDRPAAPKAKAKVRADSDAVAKGAELARSRAKASKSRRTSA